MNLWDIIYMLIFGVVVGAIARFIMPGRDPMGWFSTALLGIAGSFIGTIAKSVLMPHSGRAGWILSVIGALLVLAVYRAIAGRAT